MRTLILSLCAAMSLAAQTPIKATPCDAASLLLTAKPIYGVGDKSIAAACPAFSSALDRWYVLAGDSVKAWTARDVVAFISHGVRPATVMTSPPAPPPPIDSVAQQQQPRGQNPVGTGLLLGPLTAKNGVAPAYPSTPYFTDYGAFTAIADTTSPTGFSLRGSYTAGAEGGRTLYAALGASHSTLYARMLYKIDANWPVGGTKKVLQYRQGFDKLYSILDIESGKWHLFNAITGNWIGANAHSAYDPIALRGQWVDLGYAVEMVDATHMRHRVWVNGSLEIDVTVAGTTFSPSTVMFGGVFNSPAGNDTDWIVNAAVFTGAQE